jgi:outer membrane protein assembly factor BamB
LFPLFVLTLLAAWYYNESAASGYMTAYQLAAVLISAFMISSWYLGYGASRLRTRTLIVGVATFGMFGWLVAFRPVFNGELEIYGWRPRFAEASDRTMPAITGRIELIDWQPTSHDYPGFLGRGYWAEVKGVCLECDWRAHLPQEVWRREIGAGWSSFAIAGNCAITQEQRGTEETVSCYRLETGEPVWSRGDATRFDPGSFSAGLGGVGPRATPTIHNGRVFTQSANGYLNCFDMQTGRILWARDVRTDTSSNIVTWGKAGSPLVIDDTVIISVGTPEDKALRATYHSSLVAYDLNGAVRWAAGNRQASYCTPIVTTLAGERQIISVNEGWVTAHRMTDGAVLWEHPWSGDSDTNPNCTQPIPLAGDRLFLSKGYGVGSTLLHIERDYAGTLTVQPMWDPPIALVMQTKFANVVVRDGFIYGLDNTLLECIEIDTGKVKWKKRRRPDFGHGQILLVGNSILVLSETGELVLVEVNAEQYNEQANVQVLDPDNVTWNTLAFSAPYLLVRNAREAACYRLPLNEDRKSRPDPKLASGSRAGAAPLVR